jgi:hypothetical protein
MGLLSLLLWKRFHCMRLALLHVNCGKCDRRRKTRPYVSKALSMCFSGHGCQVVSGRARRLGDVTKNSPEPKKCARGHFPATFFVTNSAKTGGGAQQF